MSNTDSTTHVDLRGRPAKQLLIIESMVRLLYSDAHNVWRRPFEAVAGLRWSVAKG
jgi:tyrosine-protein phosphatase YwqE